MTLSKVEREIITCYTRGLTDKQIVDEIDITLGALISRSYRLREKLAPYMDTNGNSRVQLALIGVALGLGTLPKKVPEITGE
jgi:hypothetical protein